MMLQKVQVVSEIPSRAFVTATVWCVPFFGIGTVGLFNKLQTQKKGPIFTASEGGWGRASGMGCAVEIRDRPEFFRVVIRI